LADAGVPLIDALRIQALVLQNALLPEVVDRPPSPGWRVAARDDVRTMWVRRQPLPYPGRVSWTSPGVTVRSASAAQDDETVAYQALAGGGRLLFARLDWPGYSVSVDGANGVTSACSWSTYRPANICCACHFTSPVCGRAA